MHILPAAALKSYCRMNRNTPGEQEAVFEDVVIQIENDDYHVPDQRYESYACGRFQEKITSRGSS